MKKAMTTAPTGATQPGASTAPYTRSPSASTSSAICVVTECSVSKSKAATGAAARRGATTAPRSGAPGANEVAARKTASIALDEGSWKTLGRGELVCEVEGVGPLLHTSLL